MKRQNRSKQPLRRPQRVSLITILGANVLACCLGPQVCAQQLSWNIAGPLATARSQHTETLLANGTVLVAGGLTSCEGFRCFTTNSAEIYDPATGAWDSTAGMRLPRANHIAVRLQNGKVLVAGGYSAGNVTSESEIYDPDTRTWTSTGRLSVARQFHLATLLTDGKVLVTGGVSFGLPNFSLAELYDPIAGTWTAAGFMNEPRIWHTITLLSTGKVLVTGGVTLNATLRSAELFDPTTNQWTPTSEFATARSFHTATLMPNGKVLIAGGGPAFHIDDESGLDEADLYDPATGEWRIVGRLNLARSGHSATLLANGKVLLAGGSDGENLVKNAEIYDPARETWALAPELNMPRVSHSATLLEDGRLLIAGGAAGESSPFLKGSELYGTKIFTLNSSSYCVGDTWVLNVTNAPGNTPIRLIGTTKGEPWETLAWARTDQEGKYSANGKFTAAAVNKHTLRVQIGGYVSPILPFEVMNCP